MYCRLSSLVALPLLSCACAISCYDPSDDNDDDHPRYADCKHILAHLPSSLPPLAPPGSHHAQGLPDADDARMDPTTPFYPDLQVSHGTCTVTLNLRPAYQRRSLGPGPRRDVLWDAWQDILYSVDEIVETCLDDGEDDEAVFLAGGEETCVLGGTGYDYATSIYRAWPYCRLDEQRQAMGLWNRGDPNQYQSHEGHLFQTTYYELG